MATSTEKAADADVAFLRAQIRGLENQVRALRETLWDKYAMAAISGGALPAVARSVADSMLEHRTQAMAATR